MTSGPPLSALAGTTFLAVGANDRAPRNHEGNRGPAGGVGLLLQVTAVNDRVLVRTVPCLQVQVLLVLMADPA